MRVPFRLLMAAALALVVGACRSSQAQQAAELAEATLTPTIATSSPVAVPSRGCDPMDEAFAAMFVGLGEAALSNAEVAPEEFLAALASNREALKRYVAVLAIQADDAWLDAAMSADLGQRLLQQIPDQGATGPNEGNWLTCE